jgi:hypothetical protein
MSEGPSEPIESSITPDEANRIIHSHRKVRYGRYIHIHWASSFMLPYPDVYIAAMLPYMVATSTLFIGNR